MESKEFAQQPSLHNSISSGSSSTSSSSSYSSSSLDSHVDTPSLNNPEIGVTGIQTASLGADGAGSDGAGSENEGFMSGEEEFESAVDRPIVGYPEEETLGKSVPGGDNATSFSDFSSSVSVRPIAKVSVDSDVDEEDEEEDASGGLGVGLQVEEGLGRKVEIDDKVVGEDDFPESKKGSEVEIPVEKEEILVSGENENLGRVVNEGDAATPLQERTIQLLGDSKEDNVPDSSIAGDVGYVPEEILNSGKPVSEGVELYDVTVKQLQENEASDGGEEAELNKLSLTAEKQAAEGIELNDKVVAEEDVEQLKELEIGSSSDDKADLVDQESSKVLEQAGERQEAEIDEGSIVSEKQADGEIELNDKVAAEDGEQLKNLETGSPVEEDKADLGDDENSKVLEPADGGQEAEMDRGSLVAEKRADGVIKLNDKVDAEDGERLTKLETGSSVLNISDQDDQANFKVSELADELSGGVVDDKTLNESSLVSGTDAVDNLEEIKDVENRATVDLLHGAAKLDNGFDNVGRRSQGASQS